MNILVTGASGQLGAYVLDRLAELGRKVSAWSGSTTGGRGRVAYDPVDLLDRDSILRQLDATNPDVLIHAAAISAAELVRLDPVAAEAINVEATAIIAGWCGLRGRRLVFTSTDLVFQGTKPWNREDDLAEPVLAYGRTKRRAELAVLKNPDGVAARVSLLYGPSRCGRPSFFDRAITALRHGEPQRFFEDEHRTPLDLATAADILVRLTEGGPTGIVHVAGPERMSRFDLMRRSASALGLDSALVRPSRRAEANLTEPRPADVSLETTKLATAFPDLVRPTVESALRRA